MIDTDLDDIESDGYYKWYPKKWIEQHRSREPDWVESVTTSDSAGFGPEIKSPRFQAKMVKKVRSYDCDIIHASGAWGAIWASFSGLPYVYWVTGVIDWKSDKQTKNPLKRAVFTPLIRRGIRNASMVVSEPGVINALEKEYDVPTERIATMVDLERFKPDPADGDLKQRYDCDLLLFAGARHKWEHKANDTIFEGLAAVDGVDWHLVTAEWGEDIERSKELVSELGLEENVSFVPIMSRKRLRRVINQCDAVLDQFHFGGIGSLSRQTLACGTPLISKIDTSRISDNFDSDPPILSASAPDELRDRITLLTDEDQKRQLGTESRKWMERNYGWDTLGKRYLSIYRSSLRDE
ncbi:glycosyltransferase family 4 protein [Halosimplex marinum]|uniref:glycosyltransferase family 4 protein n=1 Tax=Halosimplex marinum TaxID=3396620 RepID=UPI003F566093